MCLRIHEAQRHSRAPNAQSSYMNKTVTAVIENYLNYLLNPSEYLIKYICR